MNESLPKIDINRSIRDSANGGATRTNASQTVFTLIFLFISVALLTCIVAYITIRLKGTCLDLEHWALQNLLFIHISVVCSIMYGILVGSAK